jgi:hypothetical protein
MIAQTALYYHQKGQFAGQDLVAKPRWPLSADGLRFFT